MPQVAPFAGTSIWAAIGNAAVNVAISAGLAYVAGKLTAENFETEMNIDTPQSGSLAPIRLVYGEATLAGVEVFKDSVHYVGTDNFGLHYAWMLAGHECQDVTDIWIDETFVSSGGGGMYWGDPYNAIMGGKYAVTGAGYPVKMWKHLGTDAQTADAELLAVYPSQWTSNHRLRGITYVVARLYAYSQSMTLWEAGPPNNVRFRVKGYKLYDPRKDSTNGGSGAHRMSDPTTWEWCANGPLALCHFLCFCEWGPLWDTAWINWASVIIAANDCDEAVSIPGPSTQPRFATNGALNAGRQFYDNVQDLLASFRGTLVPNGQQWDLHAGVYVGPDLTLSEKDLRSGITMEAQVTLLDRFNTIKCLYIDRDNNDVENETPALTDAAYLSRDNGFEMVRQIQTKMCNNFYQAQRLALLELRLGNQQKVVTFPGNMRPLQVLADQRVNLSIAELSFLPKVMRIEDWEFRDWEGVNLVLREDSQSAWADPLIIDYATRTATGELIGAAKRPPAPTSATVSIDVVGNLIEWINPTTTDSFDFVRVYASDSSAWAGATLVFEGRASSFKHPTLIDQWYWIVTVQYELESLRLPDSDTSTLHGVGRSIVPPLTNLLPAGYYDNETLDISGYLGLTATTSFDTTNPYIGSRSVKVEGPTAANNDWGVLLSDGAIYNVYLQPNRKLLAVVALKVNSVLAGEDGAGVTGFFIRTTDNPGGTYNRQSTFQNPPNVADTWVEYSFELLPVNATRHFQMDVSYWNRITPNYGAQPIFWADKIQLWDITDRPDISEDAFPLTGAPAATANVRYASDAQAITGTSRLLAVTPASMAAAIADVVGVGYNLDGATETVQTTHSGNVSHGLGSKPDWCSLSLVCVATEKNYQIGDRYDGPIMDGNSTLVGVTCDATKIYYSSTSATWFINSRAGGVSAWGAIDNVATPKWKLILKAGFY